MLELGFVGGARPASWWVRTSKLRLGL